MLTLNRTSLSQALLVGVIFLGLLLRFYLLPENLQLGGETGHNYLEIKNYIESQRIPLLGPPTSHPWLSFGPLFYWIFGPIMSVSGFDPVIPSMVMAAVSTSLILINYLVTRHIFNSRIALTSSFLLAISPLWLDLANQARFFSLVTVFFYPFIWFLFKSRTQSSDWLWVGVFLGLMLNFHLSPLIVFPGLALIVHNRRQVNLSVLSKFGLGLILTQTPFLIHNLLNRFEMVTKFLAWIPYRALGLSPTASRSILDSSQVASQFIQFSFVPGSFPSTIIIFLFFISLVSLVVWVSRGRSNQVSPFWMELLLIFLVSLSAIFLHGSPPLHYFMAIAPLPIWIFSWFLTTLSRRRLSFFTIAVLVIFTYVNFKFYFSNQWFFRPQIVTDSKAVPYSLQINAITAILQDAQGQNFSLKRVGSFDHYEGDYAQNYHYLLWWLGNEPTTNSLIEYTIYELPTAGQLAGQETIFNSSGLVVAKSGETK